MPMPIPSDPLNAGTRFRQASGNPFWRPPVLVMETDVNPVAAGNGPGWVSGTPANLADGASVVCVFDLGPDWGQYTVAQISTKSTVATSLSAVQVAGSDNTTWSDNRRCRSLTNASDAQTLYATVNTAGGAQQSLVKPSGRYLLVSITNTAAAGAQGASSKVAVTVYPN